MFGLVFFFFLVTKVGAWVVGKGSLRELSDHTYTTQNFPYLTSVTQLQLNCPPKSTLVLPPGLFQDCEKFIYSHQLVY